MEELVIGHIVALGEDGYADNICYRFNTHIDNLLSKEENKDLKEEVINNITELRDIVFEVIERDEESL